MKLLFWNRAKGRQTQLAELISMHRVEVFCLQEIIKSSFSQRELAPLGGNHCYSWAIKPAVGHSGGMLIAAREDLFDHIASDVGEFFTNMVVKDKNSSA